MQTSALYHKHNGILSVGDKRIEFYDFGNPVISIRIRDVFRLGYHRSMKKLNVSKMNDSGTVSNVVVSFDSIPVIFWDHCMKPYFMERRKFQEAVPASTGNEGQDSEDVEEVLLASRSSDTWVHIPDPRDVGQETELELAKRNLVQKLDEARWNIMEGLGKFSRLVRQAAGEFKGYGVVHRPWENPAFKPVIVEETEDGFSRIGYDHAERPKLFERREWTQRPVAARKPVTLEMVDLLRDKHPEKRLDASQAELLRESIYYNGIEPSARPFLWKCLLSLHGWENTDKERLDKEVRGKEFYSQLKHAWIVSLEQQTPTASGIDYASIVENRSRIEKDIARTDRLFDFGNIHTYRPEQWKIPGFDIPDESMTVGSRDEYRRCLCLRDILLTYSVYNPSLGYVQGMSDLVSPLLYVLKDEIDTFWCFSSWMKSMQHNFSYDQQAMLHNLSTMVALMSELDPLYYEFIKDKQADNFFFCFRWFLTYFKREFSNMDTIIYLWEVLWAHKDPDYMYFFALAMLETVRADIMRLENFDEILKKINDFSDTFDVEQVLSLSQGIYNFKKQVLSNCE